MVHLDTERPLSEPKWVKSGDVQEWLKSMFGRMFWVAGDAADGWEKKIAVVDPDPVRSHYLDRSLTLTILSLRPRRSGQYWMGGRSTPLSVFPQNDSAS